MIEKNAVRLVGLLAILALPTPSRAEDKKALEVADQVMAALGGEDAWKGTHFLRFDFAVDKDGKTVVTRSHTWDKWTGRYRLEGKDKDGAQTLVLMNLGTQKGKAFKNGAQLIGDAEAEALKKAYATWVNDTYWLLMPYKLKDPGVHLKYDGEKTEGGNAYDVLVLSFESVGLTPKDTYWVYVNHKTHLVDRWAYVLQGQQPPPNAFAWTGWEKKGTILLAPERTAEKGGLRIFFPVLDAPASVPDTAFTGGN